MKRGPKQPPPTAEQLDFMLQHLGRRGTAAHLGVCESTIDRWRYKLIPSPEDKEALEARTNFKAQETVEHIQAVKEAIRKRKCEMAEAVVETVIAFVRQAKDTLVDPKDAIQWQERVLLRLLESPAMADLMVEDAARQAGASDEPQKADILERVRQVMADVEPLEKPP